MASRSGGSLEIDRILSNEYGSTVRARTGKVALVTDLVLEVFRLNGRLLRSGDEVVATVGLSSARWQVLGAVAEEPLSMAAVARRMGRARQSVREVAERLTADGLLDVVPDEADRRAPRLRITERGHDLLHEVAPLQVRWAEKLAEGFSEPQLAAALDVLSRLDRRLVEMEGATQ